MQIMKQPHTESSLGDSFLIIIGSWEKLFHRATG